MYRFWFNQVCNFWRKQIIFPYKFCSFWSTDLRDHGNVECLWTTDEKQWKWYSGALFLIFWQLVSILLGPHCHNNIKVSNYLLICLHIVISIETQWHHWGLQDDIDIKNSNIGNFNITTLSIPNIENNTNAVIHECLFG
jgi:hypothetical protein